MGRDLDIAEALSAHVALFNSTFERLVDLESTRAAFSDDERRVPDLSSSARGTYSNAYTAL